MTLPSHDASPLPGPLNFRDVGGLPAGAGRTRSGVLYRSGDLSSIDRAGRDAVRALGLRRVIDLRTDAECDRVPGGIVPLGIPTTRVPLFLGSVASFFDDDMSLAEMYRLIVADATDGIIAVVRAVIAEQPVLVQCTAGKDRTGVAVALMLAASGVDEAAVIADYARSESLIAGASTTDAALTWLRRRHPDAVNLEDLVARSPAPVMAELIDELRERHGSVAEYLRTGGLADDELRELRRILVATA